jgi:hypothetical protein
VKDFLGRDCTEGDIIVYPAGSGRSITMIKARLLKIKDNGVTVQPIVGARWQQHHGRTEYRDSRTGKSFNQYSKGAEKHMVQGYGAEHKETGDWLSYEDWKELPYPVRDRDWKWAPVIWKEYVVTEKVGPKPVHLTVTANIVRVTDLVGAEQ